jgi:hypothetical protein
VNRVLAIALLALSLSACGGGGSNSQPSQSPGPSFPTQPLFISTTALDVGFVSAPYQQTLAIAGGVAPYSFTVQGTLPTGISFANGQFTGTPSVAGSSTVTVNASDASSPALTTTRTLTITVIPPQIVRNDSLADANDIPCCGIIHASFSPYSTAAGVVKPDQDFYRITATPGDRLLIQINSVGTQVDTDTTLEILEPTLAFTLSACKQPPFSATTFTANCFNDDRDGFTVNSALQLQVPANGVFTVHVADFAHRARPEMTYDLKIEKLP